jgi:hypothetical protein
VLHFEHQTKHNKAETHSHNNMEVEVKKIKIKYEKSYILINFVYLKQLLLLQNINKY